MICNKGNSQVDDIQYVSTQEYRAEDGKVRILRTSSLHINMSHWHRRSLFWYIAIVLPDENVRGKTFFDMHYYIVRYATTPNAFAIELAMKLGVAITDHNRKFYCANENKQDKTSVRPALEAHLSQEMYASLVITDIEEISQREFLNRKYITEDVTIEVTVDEVQPPPPDIKPTFENVHDWLIAICDFEKPLIPIANYELGVFESSETRVLYLVGMNKYTNPNHEKIEFEPANMYLLLPQKYYIGLTRELVADKLAKELREFTMSPKFKDSYLADSNSIILNGSKVIWAK